MTRTFLTLCAALAVASGCNDFLKIPEPETKPTDESGASGAPGSETNDECKTNSDCASAAGAPDALRVCRARQCVPLLTPDCPLVLPQADDLQAAALSDAGPEPLMIGFFSTVRTEAPHLNSFGYDYDLVLTEISRKLGGIPAGGGVPRPILAVGCSNVFTEPGQLDRAVDHLTRELGVPAVLATLELDDLEHAFERSADRKVFYFNLRDGDPNLVALPHHGLMWHMLSGWDSVATAYQPLLDRTLRHLVNQGSLAPNEPVRVALINANDYLETASLAGALWTRLRVNGKTPQANGNDYFRVFPVNASTDATRPPDQIPTTINAIRNFAPHIIITAATDEFTRLILPGLEAGSSNPAPFYLLSPWDVYAGGLVNVHYLKEDLYERVAGVNFSAAEDPTAYNAFQARFDAAYPTKAMWARGTENHYDGPYYLLYAAAAARGSWPLTGTDFGFGMLELLSGARTYTVGPDDLPAAMTALKSEGVITLNGTMGPPNFDPATGTRVDPGTVWCIDSDGMLHTDVLRVDGTDGLAGTFPCFAFDD